MLKYRYKAVNAQGEVETGYRNALALADLRAALLQEHLTLLYVLPVIALRPLHLTTGEWVHIFRNLQLLLAAGLPLVDALQECHNGLDKSCLQAPFRQICNSIKQGRTLCDAFRASGLNFPPLAFALIPLGASTGDFGPVLHSLHQHLAWQQDLQSSVRQSLRYPAFLVVVLTGLFHFLSTQVVPQLRAFFETMRGPGAQDGGALLALGHELMRYCAAGGLGVLGLLIGVYVGCRVSRASLLWRDRMIYHAPLCAFFVPDFILARFFQTFTVCMRAHLDLIQSLELAAHTTGNLYFRQECGKIKEALQNGQSLQNAFADAGLFPPMALRLLRVSDVTGSLETISARLAVFLEERLRDRIQRAISALEPGLILVLGAFLLFLVVSIFYPLYDQLASMEQ